VSNDGGIIVAVELFAELEIEDQLERLDGGTCFAPIELDHDPTNALVQAAHVQREANMGAIFGGLVRTGRAATLSRFDLYSAPFRIELSGKLRQRLTGTWEREPSS
jgi:hypothetical protein